MEENDFDPIRNLNKAREVNNNIFGPKEIKVQAWLQFVDDFDKYKEILEEMKEYSTLNEMNVFLSKFWLKLVEAPHEPGYFRDPAKRFDYFLVDIRVCRGLKQITRSDSIAGLWID